MKGLIFDLDGVLVDSMPTHTEAWIRAFKKVAGIEITAKDIYVNEGMRGIELVKKLFEQKDFHEFSLAEKVSEEKNEIFKKIRSSAPFEGVKKMLDGLECKKAVVSGSGKKDVITILDEAFGKDYFDLVITADDVKKGKPDPSAFLTAIGKLGIDKSNSMVIENAPLGVQAANNAGIKCIVVLNNTPLTRSNFKDVISEDKIFEKTKSIGSLLEKWCS